MAVELKVPEVGESITEVQIGQWRKGEGERVEKDENLVEIETDKATVDLPAPISGTIAKVLKRNGDTAAVGEVIGIMEESEAPSDGDKVAPDGVKAASGDEEAAAAAKRQAADTIRTRGRPKEPPRSAESRPSAERPQPSPSRKPEPPAANAQARDRAEQALVVSPDVPRPIEQKSETVQRAPHGMAATSAAGGQSPREEEVVPMSPIRRRIAQRLVEAQQTMALLTTFNEVDMTEVMNLRNQHKQIFQERYGVKLGFMSFFVKAVIDALKLVPQLNAEIRASDIVYHNYYDIGIAVGGGKGLVVPVLRDADRMSFAEIELAIADLAHRARENSLQLDELQGGTFTISNGGVYGSLLSTPIVNPPQSGILGLHAIQDRPVAREGQVVIRPMMYVALTYDHRIVDGQGAVTFLKRVKEVIESPLRMLIET